MVGGRVRIRNIVAATPDDRDRGVDVLRAATILIVVVGHWLAVVLQVEKGRLTGQSVLALLPATQAATWAFQVMPVFFLVGGWAATASWRAARRRGSPPLTWLGSRMSRLLLPTSLFIACSLAASLAARLAGVDPALVRESAWLAGIVLWFLAVYIPVVAATPLLVAVHDRLGLRSLVPLVAAVLVIDLVRLVGGIPAVGAINYVTVWLCFYVMGIAWHAGSLTGGWLPPMLAGGGLAAAAALVALGPYPVSMVNVPGAPFHNASPPSLALLMLGLAQCGLVLLTRPWLARVARRPAVWSATVTLNAAAMSILLYHMAAVVVVGPALFGTGLLPVSPAGSWAWSVTRPVWLAALAAVLTVMVAAVVRAEAPRPPSPPRHGAGSGAVILAGAGVGAVCAGLVALTVGGASGAGFVGLPLLGMLGYVVGLLLLYVAVRVLPRGRTTPQVPTASPQR